MAYKLTDFSDIISAIMEELKLQSSDTTSKNRIKRAINMMYLDEVVPASRWNWLYGHHKVTQKAYYAASTVSMTPLSATVTFATAPTSSYGDSGSFLNYKFSVDGDSEVYTITQHTALASTFTLSAPYNGSLNAVATYKIWKDWVSLPTDARETIDVYHEFNTKPMDGKGLSELNKLVVSAPKLDGRPRFYSTQDFYDPSPLTSETESDRYRIMRIHPSLSQYNTILNVDYIKEVEALNLDGDEPLMPVEDRIVLFYGALSIVWGSIARNPEEAARNRALFDNKLARMMGKVSDSMDKPRVEPSSQYMTALRGNRIRGLSRRGFGSAGSGGQASSPAFLKDVTIEGATITDDVTVSSGITIDGRDIGADGADLDAHIIATSDVHGVGPGNDVVGTSTTQTLQNKAIDADNNTITNLADAAISSTAAITRSKLANGTANSIVINDASGVMSELVVDPSLLLQLVYTTAMNSVTCSDNTTTETVVLTWDATLYNAVFIDYTIVRDTSREAGRITLISDGTDASIAQGPLSEIGDVGVTFDVVTDGVTLDLVYTTTNTGFDATMQYKLTYWLAEA